MGKRFLLCLLLIVQATASYGVATKIRINEVFYDPAGAEYEQEFIELYVVEGGFDPSYWFVSDLDVSQGYWEIPDSCPVVQSGEYIVIHLGSGTNDDVGPDYHYYMGKTSGVLSNDGEPIVLFEDTDSSHSYSEVSHDFMAFEGPLTDADMGNYSLWCNWANDGVATVDVGPGTSEGASVQIIGQDMDSSYNWFPMIPTPGASNEDFTINWCDNLAEVWALPTGTVVGVTATVQTPVGPINYERFHFYLQDQSAGICIHNYPQKTTQNYAAGDVIVVTGSLRNSSSVRQICNFGDPGDPIGTDDLPPVQNLTVEQYAESIAGGTDQYQSELIHFDNVVYINVPTGPYGPNTGSAIQQASAHIGSASTSQLRIEDGCELVGQTPPWRPFSITGIASRSGATVRILPRYISDMVITEPAGVEEKNWSVYK